MVVAALLALTRLAHAGGTIRGITPPCAPVGATVVLTGRGFGAENVIVTVGGLPAQVLSADGHRVTFQVPTAVTAGVTRVTATNPGGQSGCIAFRVQGPEVCGNQTDDDCNGVVDDPAVCTPVNRAPVASAGPAQTAPVGATVVLDGTGSQDPDGDPLAFTWTLTTRPAGSTAALTDAGSSTPQLPLDRPGDYTVQLVVSDGELDSAPAMTVVSTVNSAPVAHAGADQTGLVGDTLTLDGSGSSDVDGDPLTYHWTLTSQPAGSTASLSDPTAVHPSLLLDQFGTYSVQLLVHDGQMASAPATVTLSTLNSPPVADAGAPQSAPVGTLVTLDGSGSHDVDGDLLTYSWSLTTRPAGSTATLGDPASPQPTVLLDRPGTYGAQLVVNDGIVSSAPATVTVSTVNSRPAAQAGAGQSGYVGSIITLDASGSSDVDGDPLTYQWALVSRPADSTAVLSDPAGVRPWLLLDRPGTYVAQLLVSDGVLTSAPATVTLSTLNSKPVAQAGLDQTGYVGVTASLDGSGSSDVDGDLLTYQWALVSKPAGSTSLLSDATAVQPTLLLDRFGTYVVQLIVHDGQLGSEPTTVTITTLNSKPVAHAGLPQAGFVGSLLTLDGSASFDVDGDLLTYEWALTARPAGSAALLSDGTAVQPTVVLDRPGVYTAQLIVSDGTLRSDPATVTLSTLNSPPVASAGANQAVLVGDAVFLDGGGSFDVDGDPLTYQWAVLTRPEGSVADLSDATVVQPTLVPDLPGLYVVQLLVHDGTAVSAPATATVTATAPPVPTTSTTTSPTETSTSTSSTATSSSSTSSTTIPNRPPFAEAGRPKLAAVGQTVRLDGRGSFDLDGQPLAFAWALVDRPAGSTTSLLGADSPTPTLMADTVGSYVVELVVSDGLAVSDPARVTITATTAGPGVSVHIAAPADGAVIAEGTTLVRGVVQGPPNTGVTVNGVVAEVEGGQFVANDVRLAPGENTLRATASVVAGEAAEHMVQVTGEGQPRPIILDARPSAGVAPLGVTFTISRSTTTPLQTLSADFNGDGVIDLTTSDMATPLTWSYDLAGVYVARVEITDTSGTTTEGVHGIAVHDPMAIDAVFTGLWSETMGLLQTGAQEGALLRLNERARREMAPVFAALSPVLPTIVPQFSSLTGLAVGSDIAEYWLTREIGGRTRVFLIYFLRGADGVWRLASM